MMPRLHGLIVQCHDQGWTFECECGWAGFISKHKDDEDQTHLVSVTAHLLLCGAIEREPGVFDFKRDVVLT